MAPPDKSGGGGTQHGKGADGGAGADQHHDDEPCEHADGRVPTAVDQDHKACDEHTQGTLQYLYRRVCRIMLLYGITGNRRVCM